MPRLAVDAPAWKNSPAELIAGGGIMQVESFMPLGRWKHAGSAARAAEDAGYDIALTSEIGHDPFAPLVIAAMNTSRILLGTNIAVAFPRSPMVVANIAWDLQANSGGRFFLGLGSQVKGHNERRFSVPWSAPVPRLREYIQALRAIWRCWEKKEPLNFEGEHYRFTLMTPEFAPEPTGLPPVPVAVAAVREPMIRMAGRICDGVKLHGFATRKYLTDVAIPALHAGMEKAGTKRENFHVSGGGFIATGATPEEVAQQLEMIRYRVAFYGATRTYHSVFELHGWNDLGMKLHEMSKTGQWESMAKEVSDDVLHEFAAVATYADLKRAIEKRFGGLTDSLLMAFPGTADPGLQTEVVRDLQSIPSPFERFATAW
jgi:probable F420-dependent oxidoreductase